MVEEGKAETDILVSIYKKYGFEIVESGCVVEDTIVMRRPIYLKKSDNTRKKTRPLNNKSNRYKEN
jgi:hypothetical protein